MNKRTKACSIPKTIKDAVYARDRGRCIFCGQSGDPVAHYISRAKGGLGIEQNVITACYKCHTAMDSTPKRKEYLARAREHLEIFYPDFPDERRIYKK